MAPTKSEKYIQCVDTLLLTLQEFSNMKKNLIIVYSFLCRICILKTPKDRHYSKQLQQKHELSDFPLHEAETVLIRN